MKLTDVFQSLLSEADRLRGRIKDADAQALTQFLRPQLGPTPASLKRVLEPVVALVALSILVSLFALGAFSFATLAVVAGLIYAILTHVFGLTLNVAS